MGDGFDATAYTQLSVDVAGMDLDGQGRDDQRLCDLFVGKTLIQKLQNLKLAAGQRLDDGRPTTDD